MFPSNPVGLYPIPIPQAPSIDQKLGWARNYPVDHLSMGLIHFADLWFGLKTDSISDEIRYQLFFAAHAYRKPDGNINFGENSGACFYIEGLKTEDLALLYNILHAYHQHEKSTKGETKAIFGHHLKLIEMDMKKRCLTDLYQGYQIAEALQSQDKYGQLKEIREKLEGYLNINKSAKIASLINSLNPTTRIPYTPISKEKLDRHVQWKDRIISQSDGKLKMQQNVLRSLGEHIKNNRVAPYVSLEELDVINSHPTPTSPLKLVYSEFEDIGPRDEMEDAHFYFSSESYAIGGLFDGHGGADVARFAKDNFANIFLTKLTNSLTKNGYNAHNALEKTFIELEDKIIASGIGTLQGCTATCFFIDKKTHMLFTANLGDSEAKIFTTIFGKSKIIPTSCVRDWTCKFDATRISKLEHKDDIVLRYMNADNAKKLRYKGINVSRALGDLYAKGTIDMPGVTYKPKITMQRIPDPSIYGPSVLVVGCDGLWDYTQGSYNLIGLFFPFPEREKELADITTSYLDSATLAKRIGLQALVEWDSQDNVSVLTIRIT